MDLDGDGVLSLYGLEYFYEEQLQRMEQLGIETLPFEDCLCQVSVVQHEILQKTLDYIRKNSIQYLIEIKYNVINR